MDKLIFPPLREAIENLWEAHRPSKHKFFVELSSVAVSRLLDENVLQRLYLSYQASMHATRAAIYYIPHLDSVDLRMAKLKILADDDGLPLGDSHHAQLRRTWAAMLGFEPAVSDAEFGELSVLVPRLDTPTACFVTSVDVLYKQSLGPWLIIEGLANDWIEALLRALEPQFPSIGETAYFVQNYSSGVEIRHADEALEIVSAVLSARPELYTETIIGAEIMGAALDKLWVGFCELL